MVILVLFHGGNRKKNKPDLRFQTPLHERVIHAGLGDQPSSPAPRRKGTGAEPSGELRKGFPTHWVLARSYRSHGARVAFAAVVVRKNPLDCCFGCLEFVLVAQLLLLDGHKSRDIGLY